MSAYIRMPLRRIPASLQLGLRVREAAGWEALVESHRAQAAEFVRIFSEFLDPDAALQLYSRHVPVPASIRRAVETGALLRLDLYQANGGFPPEHNRSGWLQEFREGLRLQQEAERMAPLAAARVAEALLRVHLDNAMNLEEYLRGTMSPSEAVAYYIRAFDLPGISAHMVYQQALARIADRDLPDPSAEMAYRLAMLPVAPDETGEETESPRANGFLRSWRHAISWAS